MTKQKDRMVQITIPEQGLVLGFPIKHKKGQWYQGTFYYQFPKEGSGPFITDLAIKKYDKTE